MKRLIILSLFLLLALSTSVKADVTTDKTGYIPGETVGIVLGYSQPLADVKFSIIDPKGNMEISGTPMNNISSNRWGYNYTLSTRALNGTYTISITALQGGTVVNASMPNLAFKGNFDVLVWNVNTYLSKSHFTPGETMNLTVIVSDRYSDTLAFNVFYSIIDPQGNEIEAKNLTLTQVNNGFTDAYEIPANYSFGVSTINIMLVDSEGRTYNTSLSFSVSKALIVTPDAINETVTDITEKTFEFENTKDSDINIRNIEVSDGLKNLVLIVQRPYLIPSNSKAIMKIRLVASNQAEGSYSGEIDVSTDEGTIPIYVNLKVMLPATPENIDYSYIIWYFAAGIAAVIIMLTVLRYRKISKKKKEEKKKQEEKKKKEDNYYKSQEEYRTEYY